MTGSSLVIGDLTVLEAAFTALEQGITIHDRDGRIVVCNPAAARIAGLPLDEILGTRPPDYALEVRDESGALVSQEHSGVMRALRTGETELGKLVEVRRNDGRDPQWLRVNYQPLLDGIDAEPWGVVASVVEVEPPGTGGCASMGLAQDIRKALDRHAGAQVAITYSAHKDGIEEEVQNLRAEILDLVETLDDALKARQADSP